MTNVNLIAGKASVTVCPDYYGEKTPRLSLIVDNPHTDEIAAQLRFDEDGQLVEVFVDDGIRIQRCGDPVSPWQIERDGDY